MTSSQDSFPRTPTNLVSVPAFAAVRCRIAIPNATLSGFGSAAPDLSPASAEVQPRLPQAGSPVRQMAASGPYAVQSHWRPTPCPRPAVLIHTCKTQYHTDNEYISCMDVCPPGNIFPGPDPSGHKLLGPDASLSVGQSWEDFYVR